MSPSSSCYPTPAVPLADHPAILPTANIAEDVDHASAVKSTLQCLPELDAVDLIDSVIWRDSLAFTGTLRTFFGAAAVANVWQQRTAKFGICDIEMVAGTSQIMRMGPETCWIQAMFSFATSMERPARCSGIIGLVPDESSSSSSGWKIWMLNTILEQPEGFPDVDGLQPPGEERPIRRDCSQEAGGSTTVECLVVGAGVGGLTMAARLQALGLSYLVVERSDHLGENWTSERYQSLKLHTSTAFNVLPGTPQVFTPDHPYHMDTSHIADGFQKYVDTFKLNVRLSTLMLSAAYDEANESWTASIQTNGKVCSVSARHIVLAVGVNGINPKMPKIPNRDLFKGDILHGGEWRDGKPWAGKSGICVGSANTAHGIIDDMAKEEFQSITMLQRSRTFVLPASTFAALMDPVYNFDIPVEVSDRLLLGCPLPVQRLMAVAGVSMCAAQNAPYFDALQAGGFDVERNGDLWGLLYDREGGHFFDIGAGEHIANGTVKVRNDATLVSYTETGLEMSDGSQIDADVIVFATGYSGNMKTTAKKFFGEEIGDTLEECGAVDEEGESRGSWRDVGHRGLWYTGHGFAHARYYSRFVAMRIKADVEGRDWEVYSEKHAPSWMLRHSS